MIYRFAEDERDADVVVEIGRRRIIVQERDEQDAQPARESDYVPRVPTLNPVEGNASGEGRP